MSSSSDQLAIGVSKHHSSNKINNFMRKINSYKTLNRIRLFLIKPLIFLFIFLLTWGICGICIIPPSNFFSLFLLYIVSVYCGEISEMLHLPDLFGMIIAGCICRNIPQLQIDLTLDADWSSFFRNTALVVILIRAGMGLDPTALKRLSCGVIRLALTPCLLEIATASIVSKFLLNLSWTYGLILGSVLGAVSPAVVVPCLLHLSAQGYGVDKGIPTLVIAASSIDDVFAITLFGVFLGFTFGSDNIVWLALKSPLELLIGIAYGGVTAYVFWRIPPRKYDKKVEMRTCLLLLTGMTGLFTSSRLNMGGIGPIASIVLGFVVMLGWKKEVGDAQIKLSEVFEMLWTLVKPFLFVLIGAEMDLSKMNGTMLGKGLLVLVVCLLVRMLTTFVVVSGNKLSLKEKIFITIAWLPKATVQAAIGGMALDKARRLGKSGDELVPAFTVVTIAVLSIVATAPLGAILITKLGPRLLNKSSQNMNDMLRWSGDVNVISREEDNVNDNTVNTSASVTAKNNNNNEIEVVTPL